MNRITTQNLLYKMLPSLQQNTTKTARITKKTVVVSHVNSMLVYRQNITYKKKS